MPPTPTLRHQESQYSPPTTSYTLKNNTQHRHINSRTQQANQTPTPTKLRRQTPSTPTQPQPIKPTNQQPMHNTKNNNTTHKKNKPRDPLQTITKTMPQVQPTNQPLDKAQPTPTPNTPTRSRPQTSTHHRSIITKCIPTEQSLTYNFHTQPSATNHKHPARNQALEHQ